MAGIDSEAASEEEDDEEEEEEEEEELGFSAALEIALRQPRILPHSHEILIVALQLES